MKISVRGWFVLGTFAAVLIALVAFSSKIMSAADDEPTIRLQERPAQGQLGERSLGALLQQLGLDVIKEDQRYDFAFKAHYQGDEWDLSMSAVLSQNGESLWVMAWLDELPRTAVDVPRKSLLRLLAQNDRMGKGQFFAYIAGNHRFVLERVVPNRNVSPAAMRSVLKDLGIAVVENYPYWAVTNWKANKPNTSETAGSDRSASGASRNSGPSRTAPRNQRRTTRSPRRRKTIRR